MMTTMMKRRAPEVKSEFLNKGGRWYKLDEIFQAATKIRLDACIEIATLLENEGISQRDPKYITQDDIARRYGISRESIAQYKAIGDDKRVVSALTTELPKSLYTVYLLTTIKSQKDFDTYRRPDVTREEIAEYKRRLAPPAPAPVAPQPPQRPPCPGVEGKGPGEYRWGEVDNQWIKHLTDEDFRTPYSRGEGPTTPEQDTREASNNALPKMSMRDWAIEYLKFCKHESVIKVVETIRRCEHGDRGGSDEITSICNMYLSKEN